MSRGYPEFPMTSILTSQEAGAGAIGEQRTLMWLCLGELKKIPSPEWERWNCEQSLRISMEIDRKIEEFLLAEKKVWRCSFLSRSLTLSFSLSLSLLLSLSLAPASYFTLQSANGKKSPVAYIIEVKDGDDEWKVSIERNGKEEGRKCENDFNYPFSSHYAHTRGHTDMEEIQRFWHVLGGLSEAVLLSGATPSAPKGTLTFSHTSVLTQLHFLGPNFFSLPSFLNDSLSLSLSYALDFLLGGWHVT